MANNTFLKSCLTTFQTFDFSVSLSRNRSSLWDFTAMNPNGDKKYVVYCAPDLSKVKNLIKITLKKIPSGSRLVIVCKEFTSDDQDIATTNEYSVVTLNSLIEFGTEMLEIKKRGKDSILDKSGPKIKVS